MPPRPPRKPKATRTAAKKRKPPAGKRRRPRRAAETTAPDPRGERLQKVLAAAGLGSRRKCEELILAARVEVDRAVVTELGTRVNTAGQEVRVDGVALPKTRLVYYIINKPDGVICSSRDPSGRPRVLDLMPNQDVRLFTVGRLDLHSEGLLLVTNDGELANRITHPRYGIQKVYRVLVAGRPTRELLVQLRHGIHLAEAFVRVPSITIKSRNKQSTVLEMVLEEGRNREIRRVLASIGHKVLRLVRMSVGPIKLGDLEPGQSRRLRRDEVRALKDAAKI
jgi:23S rRNA pseudouridine2605 synthase